MIFSRLTKLLMRQLLKQKRTIRVISLVERAAKDKAEPTETEESSFADLGIQVEADMILKK